ncbi:MAG: hypothetical protein P1P89_23295, partial [Desulfobacterales bacterium]|nr:hypothetical protein [Desulfobacterales bacterium]
VSADGLERSFRGINPFETAFFFLAYLLGKINQTMEGGEQMATCCIETTDIFRGAFFLCKGGDLTDVRIRNNGKPIRQQGRILNINYSVCHWRF